MGKIYLPFDRPRALSRLPWNYEPDPENKMRAIPVKKLCDALEKGKDYLDEGASMQMVAEWISQNSGKPITGPTVMRYYNEDPDREAGRKARSKLVSNYTVNHARKKKLRRDESGKIVREIANVKVKLTRAEKKLQRLQANKKRIEEDMKEQEQPSLPLFVEPEPVVEAAPAEEVIKPNPGPQTDFLSASEFEVLFGGAAGPGKSWALNVDPLRTVHLASHRAITFRRTNDELRELIWMTKELYPKIIPGAKFQEQRSTWIFPNGGTHWFRYLDRDEDVLSMQGQSFTWVGFDELTQWPTPFVYNYMRSRVRTTDDAIRPYLAIRSTSNPGGPGHGWVKRMFVDPGKPNTAFPATDLDTGKVLIYPPGHEKAGQPLFYRRFIPALLKDNPHLVKDTSYEASLLSLPETQRRQLLEGDWDIVDGAAFNEFRRYVHVCDPFELPSHWTRFRACDWGYDQPFCVLWFAVDNDNRLYVYRELYGRKKVSTDLADMILSAEAGENISYGILDSHCWDKRDGNATVEESMRLKGCFWRPAANRSKDSRIPTKQEVHRRLQIHDTIDPATGESIQKANVVIFSNCTHLIRTLPSIPVDKNNSEDVDTDSEDHCYDAFRYGCASRPLHRNLRVPVSITAAPTRKYNSYGFPV